jgi:flagellar assembly factor FliW
MNTLDMTEPGKTTQSDEVVLIPYGLLGFERVKNYRLLADPAVEPFLWFEMQQDPKQAFLVLCPEMVAPNYQPDLDDQDVEFLALEDPADAFILNTVTLRDGGRATVNLKSPIVINRRTWIGKQVIPINAAQYPVRHPLPLT